MSKKSTEKYMRCPASTWSGHLSPSVDVPAAAPSLEMLEHDLLAAEDRFALQRLELLRVALEREGPALEAPRADDDRVGHVSRDPDLAPSRCRRASRRRPGPRAAPARRAACRRCGRRVSPSQEAFPEIRTGAPAAVSVPSSHRIPSASIAADEVPSR